MIEQTARDCVFHFNKKHLEDPNIPMWVLKFSGKTFYVHHVECSVPWSTKETPSSSHTKGAIKIKRPLIRINDDNEAEIRPCTKEDLARLRAARTKKYHARVIVHNRKGELREFLESNSIQHSEIKEMRGSCGTQYLVMDIATQEDMVLLALTFHGSYRVLQENEFYYKAYDDPDFDGAAADYDEDEYDEDDGEE